MFGVSLDSVSQLVSIVSPFLSLAGAGALSVSGLLPRIGPGRAAWIALRSRLAPQKYPVSVRDIELGQLRGLMRRPNWGQNYLVVTGDKGVGKSCLLNTATSRTAGVVNVKAQTGDNEHAIIKTSLQSLTNLPFDFIPPKRSARRVIFWYWVFTFGRTPIIVIHAAERKIGQDSASLTGAVRSLVDDYHLRVIVDGSPNSVDDTLLRTNRANIVEIQPMTKDMIWSLPQLNDLLQIVKESGLEHVIWAVFGGNPSKYEWLWFRYGLLFEEGQDKRELLGKLLCEEISAAIKLVDDSAMRDVISLFDPSTNMIVKRELESKNLKRPSPDKIFREVEKHGAYVFIPASSAIGIVLRNKVRKKPSLEELEKMTLEKSGDKHLQ